MTQASSISLSHKALSFSARRCGEGPAVFCLHGFPDNLHTFDALLPALAQAGFGAIAPAMRGYEPASQPADGDYSIAAIAGDVIAWADDIGAAHFHIVGHDWGAVVAYVAAAMAPERIHSITTMAVPHSARFGQGLKKVPSQAVNSWYMNFFQIRGVAEHTCQRNDWALIRKLWRTWSPGYRLSDDEWNSLRTTFEAPGVLSAMLAYYRQNATLPKLLGWSDSAMTKNSTVPVPTLALTGSDDGCIDTRLYDHVMHAEDFPAGLCVERLPNVGHFLHREDPSTVTTHIQDWLRRHP